MVRTSTNRKVPMAQETRCHALKNLRVIALSFSLLLMGNLAMSQLPTATILGAVKDSTSAVIPGAAITAKNVETGLTRTGVSAEDGSYRFSALPVGSYEVRVELPGFQTEVHRYFDPNAFTLQDAGFLGSSGRNYLTGPGYTNLDFSLGKNIPVKQLGDSGALEFRGEFFNILNHPNFAMNDLSRQVFAGAANGEAPLPTAGVINTTGSARSRQIQFALKLLF